jgi:cysteine desulfurase
MIYLDYNATAPVHEAVIEAMADALRFGGNPSSVHGSGRAARALLERARARIAQVVGMRSRDLLFTSGGTEANALALASFPGLPILTSAIEHPSVLEAAPGAQRIPVCSQGQVDLAALEALLAQGPRLVSVMAANNETGVLQPIHEVASLVRQSGGRFHCDATQALGKNDALICGLDADLITLSAHKLGGPPGVGALAVKPGVDVLPLWRGGGQEMGRRAGTEPLPAIAGFAAAIEALAALGDWTGPVAVLRDGLEQQLLALAPDGIVYGAGAARLANTLCIGLPGVAAETQVMALDLAGVAVSAGSACSSGKVRASPVLAAMGANPAAAGEAIRISLGWRTSAADIAACAAAWGKLAERRRAA